MVLDESGPESGISGGLISRITSIDGAVQMKPAYAAEPPTAGALSTRTTDAPSFAALLAAVKPAMPAPSTSRSIVDACRVMSLRLRCLVSLTSA